jgi:hypothetical protein
MRHHLQLLSILSVLLLFTSCNSRNNTVGLQGEVSFDGQVIERGTISFWPIEGTVGPSAGAPIVGGRYEVPTAGGLLPDGTYEVRIIGLRKTGKTEPNRFEKGAPPIEVETNFIPPTYNSKSILKVRVSDLPDKSKADFSLDR